jgi:phosphoenolpyruvate synthase/pyruvate phosphate dikinase
VVPFGVFRELLDRPIEAGGPSVWEWMRSRYAAMAKLSAEERDREVPVFLERLRGWIENVELDPAFEARFVAMLQETFGPDGSWGVFVRSDTNVEDLPGFTGAGLNLTVPNVVGSRKVLRALREVWASPFTERAFSWRQSHMDQPEYVFPAVTIQLAFGSEKSGVLVSNDVDTGSFEWLSVAVSEGVGGAVDGQAAEALRIRADGSAVRLLAHATAPLKSVPDPLGGLTKVPASGTSAVLTDDEIATLVKLAKLAPQQFPTLRGDDGEVRAADIEFGFRGGKLALLQIRPLNESKRAQRNAFLVGLDDGLRRRGNRMVELSGVPEVAAR